MNVLREEKALPSKKKKTWVIVWVKQTTYRSQKVRVAGATLKREYIKTTQTCSLCYALTDLGLYQLLTH